MQSILWTLRLGWLLRFISHSVISGFTTASAIVIALSQAKYFLGYDIVRSSKIVPLIKSIIAGADGVCFACPSGISFTYYLVIYLPFLWKCVWFCPFIWFTTKRDILFLWAWFAITSWYLTSKIFRFCVFYWVQSCWLFSFYL